MNSRRYTRSDRFFAAADTALRAATAATGKPARASRSAPIANSQFLATVHATTAIRAGVAAATGQDRAAQDDLKSAANALQQAGEPPSLFASVGFAGGLAAGTVARLSGQAAKDTITAEARIRTRRASAEALSETSGDEQGDSVVTRHLEDIGRNMPDVRYARRAPGIVRRMLDGADSLLKTVTRIT